jgi:integrase
MAENITQSLIDRLESPDIGNSIVYDTKIRGFGVRITSAGVKSFVLNYRIRGRERRYTIGRCEDFNVTAARAEAEELRGKIAIGDDPLEQKEAERKQFVVEHGMPNFADLCREYMEEAKGYKRKKTLSNHQSILNSILLPHFGERAPGEILSDDLIKIHKSLKTTPYVANRALSLASSIFSWVLKKTERKEKFSVAENPVKGVPRYHEDRHEVWLSTEELESLTSALNAYSEQDAADAIRLLILTGSREGEVLNASWPQFDLPRGIWTKPSHHTKQQKIEHVPLSEAALLVLRRMAANRTGNFLFPGRQQGKGEKRVAAARVTIRRPWVQVCKVAGLVMEQRIQGKRKELIRYKPTVRIHDLRHTYASHLVSKGISLHRVGKLLGHTRPETTARYAHVADEALRAATNLFGDMLHVKQPPKATKHASRRVSARALAR